MQILSVQNDNVTMMDNCFRGSNEMSRKAECWPMTLADSYSTLQLAVIWKVLVGNQDGFLFRFHQEKVTITIFRGSFQKRLDFLDKRITVTRDEF